MESTILACSFAGAIAIAACVVILFSKSMDDALARVVPGTMASAWSLYAKFAVFTAAFAGGMRLADLERFGSRRPPSGAPLSAAQGLLEVFNTVTGSLLSASGILFAFFAATLAVDAAMRLRESHRAAAAIEPAAPRAAAPTPAPAAAERRPVGTARHSASRESRPDRGPQAHL